MFVNRISLLDVLQDQFDFMIRVIKDMLRRVLRTPSNLLSAISLQRTPAKIY